MIMTGKVKIILLLTIFVSVLTIFILGSLGVGISLAVIPPQPKIKAAFVYVGPIGDAGWTYAHDQGRKYLEKQLNYVETAYVESVPEGADATRVITQYAQQGYNLIFTTSFGYMDSTIEVAQKFPHVVFMHCSGYKTAENSGTYFGRMYQARYLSGLVAGKMTRSNIVGYVAAHPIPEVIRGINAFTIGVREANPKGRVHVVWTQTWYDPATEREAAESLLDIGADVIAQHQDSPAAQQAAAARGKYCIGYNSDMSAFAPNAHLTAPIWNWGVLYVDLAKKVHAGAWKSEQIWWGMDTGIVGLAPFGPMVPEEVKKLVEAKKKEIIAGRFDVFDGPIRDQEGKICIPAGKRASDEEKLSMSYFVEGVVGTIPR